MNSVPYRRLHCEPIRRPRLREWLALAVLIACWGVEARLPRVPEVTLDAAAPAAAPCAAALAATAVTQLRYQYFASSTSS